MLLKKGLQNEKILSFWNVQVVSMQPKYNFKNMYENNELRNFSTATVVSVGGNIVVY